MSCVGRWGKLEWLGVKRGHQVPLTPDPSPARGEGGEERDPSPARGEGGKSTGHPVRKHPSPPTPLPSGERGKDKDPSAQRGEGGTSRTP